MKTPAALIFDVDGTLAETEELHRAAFNEAFAAAGLPWRWDRTLYAELLAVTGGKERIAYAQTLTAGSPQLTQADISALHAAKTRLYSRRVQAGGVCLRPGVRRLIIEAKKAGLQLGIATTTSLPNVTALLSACAPLPAFDVIAAGDSVASKKPAPDIYELALHQLQLPPDACLAIEDTLNGLLSARGAGVPCLITVSAYGGVGPFPGAVAVVSDLGEPTSHATSLSGAALPDGLVDLPYIRALATDDA